MIYIVIVNYYSSSLIQKLIQSIPNPNSAYYQVIIINNSVDDIAINELKSETVKIVNSPKNLGFGEACNLGIKIVYDQEPSSIIWLLNPDTFFPKTSGDDYWLFLQDLWQDYRHISLLGTIILTPDHEPWFTGGKFIRSLGIIQSVTFNNLDSREMISECDWISGCSLMINLSQFKECPRFDADFFLYYEDFDFCTAYKSQGHIVAIANQIKIFHQASSTTNQNPQNKLYHSSYSYLLTLHKHTNFFVFFIHFIKFMISGLLLFFVNPTFSRSKFSGAFKFIQKTFIQSKS